MHDKHMRISVLKGLIQDLHSHPDDDLEPEMQVTDDGMNMGNGEREASVPNPGMQSDELKKKLPGSLLHKKMG